MRRALGGGALFNRAIKSRLLSLVGEPVDTGVAYEAIEGQEVGSTAAFEAALRERRSCAACLGPIPNPRLASEELLQVERIGRNGNFFELGRHSLLGVKLMARIGEKRNMRPPVAAIFQFPTIRQIGELVETLLYENLRPPSSSDSRQVAGNM